MLGAAADRAGLAGAQGGGQAGGGPGHEGGEDLGQAGLGGGVGRPVALDLGPDDVELAAAGEQVGRGHDLGLERLGLGGDRAERGLAGGELGPQLGGALLVGDEGGLALLDLGERGRGPGQGGAGAGELAQAGGGALEGVGGHAEGTVGGVGVDVGVGVGRGEVDGGEVLAQGADGAGRGALGLGQPGAGVVEDRGLGDDRRGPAGGRRQLTPAGDLGLGRGEDLGPGRAARPAGPTGRRARRRCRRRGWRRWPAR